MLLSAQVCLTILLLQMMAIGWRGRLDVKYRLISLKRTISVLSISLWLKSQLVLRRSKTRKTKSPSFIVFVRVWEVYTVDYRTVNLRHV